MSTDNLKIFTAIVFNNGKITIPNEQRELLDIVDGDKVTVYISDVHKNKEET